MRTGETLPALPAGADLVPLAQLGGDTLLGEPAHATEHLRAVAVVEIARPAAQNFVDLRDQSRHRHRGAAPCSERLDAGLDPLLGPATRLDVGIFPARIPGTVRPGKAA
jgi:hypothetical protein